MAVLLSDQLARMGHDVDIFVGSMFEVTRDPEDPNDRRASIHYVKERLRWILPPSSYPFAPSISSHLKKGQYDAVITTDLIQPCTLAALSGYSRDPRVFVWEELASHPRFPASSYSKCVFSFSRANGFKGVRRIVPRSESAQRFLASERVPQQKISRIIPNGVDCGTFSPRQPRDFFESAGMANVPRPRIVMVARIDKHKGIETFLMAARTALDKGYEGSFVLKMTGPGMAEVEMLANSLRLSGKVTMIGGYLPRKALANLMASCDICAAPSSGDLLFFVPLEAMASGLPVITTAGTHHADTFSDGKAGLIVPTNDSETLAEAFIDLSLDQRRLKQMAAAARDLAVKEFSMETVASRFVEEFERPRA
ncbi:MAG: glycosyltransferase family 4 protein [Thermoplasmatota archaeon]